MIEFLGRLHPLIVHLPIGILLLAAIFNFVSRYKPFRQYVGASRATLLIGSISSVLACVSGFALSNPSYDADVIAQHKYLGIITAFASLLLLWLVNAKKTRKKNLQKNLNSSLYLFLIPLIFATGHLGGSLTHGEGFLFPENPVNELSSKVKAFIPSASIYSQLVQPLLQEKCYTCHSSKKQKGKLRLDSEEFILKGGKGGPIISVNGESEILFRIHLPIEDDDHMPPSDNNQLTSSEIDLLTTWVESGASFNSALTDYPDSSSLLTYIHSKFVNKKPDWWPTNNVGAPSENSIHDLIKTGVTIEPLSDESNYLHVSFISLDSFPETIWKDVLKLKSNIVSIRFTGVKLKQSDYDNLAQLSELRKLFLNRSITGSINFGSLSNLKQLRYLNLSDNLIRANQVKSLTELRSLETLYLFKTDVTEDDIAMLKKMLPDCSIGSGSYSLQELATDTLIYRKK